MVAGIMYGLWARGLALGGHARRVWLCLCTGRPVQPTIGGISVDPMDIAQGIAVGVGVTTLAAFLPAWRGTTITVRKALDSYGISGHLRARLRWIG